jgi:glycosyltransferase involved in cell wall biosynthesis
MQTEDDFRAFAQANDVLTIQWDRLGCEILVVPRGAASLGIGAKLETRQGGGAKLALILLGTGLETPDLAIVRRLGLPVFVPTSDLRQLYIALGLEPSRVFVLREAPSLTLSDAGQGGAQGGAWPAEIRRPNGERLLLCPGRIKGGAEAGELVQAFSDAASLRSLRLVFANMGGDAMQPVRKAIEEAAEQRGISQKIELLTRWLTNAEYRSLIASAHLAILPYERNRLDPSFSVWNVLSMGVPTVTSQAPAFRELGGAVFRVTAGFGLTGAIVAALDREGLRRELSAAGRAWVGARTWSDVVAEMAAVIAASRVGIIEGHESYGIGQTSSAPSEP